MCWRVWVCVCVDVCRPSSVNIVLCSSNSSSSGSAVAAHSTVYFPSWRTTSYQISRHCLQACCPTTRSRRISRLLSSGLSYRDSAHSRRLTAKQATHISISDNNSICSELMHKSLLKKIMINSARWTNPQLTQADMLLTLFCPKSRCDTLFSPCNHGNLLS